MAHIDQVLEWLEKGFCVRYYTWKETDYICWSEQDKTIIDQDGKLFNVLDFLIYGNLWSLHKNDYLERHYKEFLAAMKMYLDYWAYKKDLPNKQILEGFALTILFTLEGNSSLFSGDINSLRECFNNFEMTQEFIDTYITNKNE